MAEEQGVVRRVAWRELCPWLVLLRTFRLAISLPLLLLGTAGALLTPLGWQLSGALFLVEDAQGSYFQRVVEQNGRWPDRAGAAPVVLGDSDIQRSGSLPAGASNLVTVYMRFVEPFWRLHAPGGLDTRTRVTRAAYLLFGGIWNIAVWSLLAGAITRMAAVYLGREERVSLREALGHAARNYVWYFAAPFFPLLGVLLLALPLFVLGLLMQWSVGVLLAGLLWVLVLAAGLVMAILLLGLAFGWPLMWPAISSEEGGDAFEAFSRSYSYTFQRPLHYLFFAVVAILFGVLCWLLVSRFAAAVVSLPLWVVSWGAGAEKVHMISFGSLRGIEWAGAGLIGLFNGLVMSVAAGFNYSFFFCVATAIYLLLRREYDRTEMDEVFVIEQEEEYGLPPLPGDEAAGPDAVPSGQPSEATEASGPE